MNNPNESDSDSEVSLRGAFVDFCRHGQGYYPFEGLQEMLHSRLGSTVQLVEVIALEPERTVFAGSQKTGDRYYVVKLGIKVFLLPKPLDEERFYSLDNFENTVLPGYSEVAPQDITDIIPPGLEKMSENRWRLCESARGQIFNTLDRLRPEPISEEAGSKSAVPSVADPVPPAPGSFAENDWRTPAPGVPFDASEIEQPLLELQTALKENTAVLHQRLADQRQAIHTLTAGISKIAATQERMRLELSRLKELGVPFVAPFEDQWPVSKLAAQPDGPLTVEEGPSATVPMANIQEKLVNAYLNFCWTLQQRPVGTRLETMAGEWREALKSIEIKVRAVWYHFRDRDCKFIPLRTNLMVKADDEHFWFVYESSARPTGMLFPAVFSSDRFTLLEPVYEQPQKHLRPDAIRRIAPAVFTQQPSLDSAGATAPVILVEALDPNWHMFEKGTLGESLDHATQKANQPAPPQPGESNRIPTSIKERLLTAYVEACSAGSLLTREPFQAMVNKWRESCGSDDLLVLKVCRNTNGVFDMGAHYSNEHFWLVLPDGADSLQGFLFPRVIKDSFYLLPDALFEGIERFTIIPSQLGYMTPAVMTKPAGANNYWNLGEKGGMTSK